jgi:DNA-binding NarL/FixJ family response regulator
MLKADVVILDTEIPEEPGIPARLAELTKEILVPPKILYTGTKANRDILEKVMSGSCSGYVLKQDILYALGSAVSLAASGTCVITPGIYQAAQRYAFPNGTIILDGRRLSANFSRREKELIRLGIIFNLAIRDIADELVLGAGWVSEIVSTIYKKLGVREILTGEVPLDMYFTNESVLSHCQGIINRSVAKSSEGKLRKAPWMSTLAFHLLTVPEMDEI